LTQRLLTADELADARTAYNAIGKLYKPTNADDRLVEASVFIGSMVDNATTDGKPLRKERPPTAADIGKRVKCKLLKSDACWSTADYRFVGFASDGLPVVELGSMIHAVQVCIIDEEAAQ
jgi:hypothetical protein